MSIRIIISFAASTISVYHLDLKGDQISLTEAVDIDKKCFNSSINDEDPLKCINENKGQFLVIIVVKNNESFQAVIVVRLQARFETCYFALRRGSERRNTQTEQYLYTIERILILLMLMESLFFQSPQPVTT